MALWQASGRRAAAILAGVVTVAACGDAKSVTERVRSICVRDSRTPQRELRELRAIDDARVASLTRALGEALQDVYWLRVAAASGDTELGMSATNLGRRAAARVQTAAFALNAPECAAPPSA